MSIEFYLAVNLISDLALLGVVSRSLGLFNWRRIGICAALCAAYSVQAAVRPEPWASPAIQAVLLCGICLLISGRTSFALWQVAVLSTSCAALVCGGIGSALGLSGATALPICLTLGLILTSLLTIGSPQVRGHWQVRLILKVNGKSVYFPALIDTGNCLREPLSGLPVLVAETSLLKGLLPERGYRVLRYGALGGEGRLACFKPDGVWIVSGRHRRRTPEVWVAASPDPLPGLHRALAPPEFALLIK